MEKRFILIRAANWQLLFLYQFHRFQNLNLWYFFQTFFARKRGLGHPYFLYANKSLQHFISHAMRQMATILGLEIRFFSQVQSLNHGPFFRRCQISSTK